MVDDKKAELLSILKRDPELTTVLHCMMLSMDKRAANRETIAAARNMYTQEEFKRAIRRTREAQAYLQHTGDPDSLISAFEATIAFIRCELLKGDALCLPPKGGRATPNF